MAASNGRDFDVSKAATKGAGSLVTGLIPLGVGVVAALAAHPNAWDEVRSGWPSLVAALALAAVKVFRNWLKNR